MKMGMSIWNSERKRRKVPGALPFVEERHRKNGGNLYKICYTLKRDCRKNKGFDCCKAGAVWESVGKSYRTLCIKNRIISDKCGGDTNLSPVYLAPWYRMQGRKEKEMYKKWIIQTCFTTARR